MKTFQWPLRAFLFVGLLQYLSREHFIVIRSKGIVLTRLSPECDYARICSFAEILSLQLVAI